MVKCLRNLGVFDAFPQSNSNITKMNEVPAEWCEDDGKVSRENIQQ